MKKNKIFYLPWYWPYYVFSLSHHFVPDDYNMMCGVVGVVYMFMCIYMSVYDITNKQINTFY